MRGIEQEKGNDAISPSGFGMPGVNLVDTRHTPPSGRQTDAEGSGATMSRQKPITGFRNQAATPVI
jgi:hypothetical protein